jgi:hypothetical protein
MKVSTPRTAMPARLAVMLPVLVIPPVKVEMVTQPHELPTRMPEPAPAWIVPAFNTPPEKTVLLLMRMPVPLLLIRLVPSITMPPLIVPLSMIAPLIVLLLVTAMPPGLIVPVLTTLPFEVALLKLRLGSVPALVQPVMVTLVLVVLHAAARADCGAAPEISAATDVVASKSPIRVRDVATPPPAPVSRPEQRNRQQPNGTIGGQRPPGGFSGGVALRPHLFD